MRIEAVPAVPAAGRDGLLDLWVAAWAATMPAIDFSARRPWLSARLDALLAAGALLLLARQDAALAGFLTLDPHGGEIDQLAVDPVQAGRGTGRLLLAEAKRRCPAGLHLTVNTANARALRLYRRNGFTVTGEGANPRSGLPTLSMAWRPDAA